VNRGYDREKLRQMLANEADMAAKRRVYTILDYLDAQPGERILDCGCGLGWTLKVLEELYDCDFSGIDNDLQRLRTARAEIGPRVGIAAADVLHLPFPDGALDKVVLSEVLEHVPDDLASLLEVRRVVRPGGLIAITVPNHDYPFLWDPINWTRERLKLAPIREGFFGGLWTNHERLYYREQIVDLVGRANLAIEDVRQFVHYCFPFAHNLVYGVGMRLVESGLLAEADRFRYETNTGSPWSPLNVGRRVFNAIDRWNDDVSDEGRATVVLSVKARKVGA
jgi:2-polyprenyl-6-hydroxyphenyl methylase/3-demethylubiquinone-9 3-methyltransferase